MKKNFNHPCSDRRLEAITRNKRILDARYKLKKPYAQIAQEEGMSSYAVGRIISEELARYRKELGSTIAQHRDEQLVSIDATIGFLWEIVNNLETPMKTKMEAMKIISNFTTQKSRLLGLDKVNVDLTSGGSPVKIIAGIDENDI